MLKTFFLFEIMRIWKKTINAAMDDCVDPYFFASLIF